MKFVVRKKRKCSWNQLPRVQLFIHSNDSGKSCGSWQACAKSEASGHPDATSFGWPRPDALNEVAPDAPDVRASYRGEAVLPSLVSCKRHFNKSLSVVGVRGRGHYDRPVTPTIRACFFCCKLQATMVAARIKY